MTKIIQNPDYLWQEQINSIFEFKEKDSADIFFNILNLVLNIDIKNKELLTLFKLVGLDNFSKIINAFNGKTIKLISSEQLKDATMLALLYYRREIKKESWAEIKKELPFDVNTIKYGIRIKNLNETLRREIQSLFEEY